jgi:hypothetical protein
MKAVSEDETLDRVDEPTGTGDQRCGAVTRTHTVAQDKWSNKLSIFAVGVGVGALVGLFFAPASGKRTRKYITGSVKQGLDDAASTSKRWSRIAKETVGEAKANVSDVVDAGQKAYRAARNV